VKRLQQKHADLCTSEEENGLDGHSHEAGKPLGPRCMVDGFEMGLSVVTKPWLMVPSSTEKQKYAAELLCGIVYLSLAAQDGLPARLPSVSGYVMAIVCPHLHLRHSKGGASSVRPLASMEFLYG